MAGVLASRGSSLSGSTPATSISQADRSQFEKTGSVAIRGNVDPREINQRLSRPGISAAEIARPKMDAAGEPADGTHSAPPLHARHIYTLGGVLVRVPGPGRRFGGVGF